MNWETTASMSRRDINSGELERVRREIDEIDDGLLDLLKRRFRAVARVKEIKELAGTGPATPVRPAREAQVIRRLVAASAGEVPEVLIARLWFELMAAASLTQAPLSLHIPATPRRPDWQDLIRFHSGCAVPVVEHARAEDAVRAVAASTGDFLLCPLGSGDGALDESEARCMSAVFGTGSSDLRVVARLPFVAGAAAVAAFVIGKAPFEPSGNDVTLFAVADGEIDDAGLAAVGLENAGPPKSYAGVGWHVLALAGYIEEDDRRLASAAAASGVGSLRRLGGYARAIQLREET